MLIVQHGGHGERQERFIARKPRHGAEFLTAFGMTWWLCGWQDRGVEYLPRGVSFLRLSRFFDGEELIAFDGVDGLVSSGGPANLDIGDFGGA